MNYNPGESRTLIEVLQMRAGLTPHRPAYVFLEDGEENSSKLTYLQLDQQARAIAKELLENHEPGDRVLIVLPAGLNYVRAFLGCLYAGMIAVPAYPPNIRKRQMDRNMLRLNVIASDADLNLALTNGEIYNRIQDVPASLGRLKELTWIRLNDIDYENYHDPELGSPSLIRPENIAFLQYTSGSTGAPKGVMVTHENIMHNELMIKVGIDSDERTTFVGWLPLFHDMGLIGNMLHPLYIGSLCVLMSPMHFVQKPIRWLKAISKYGAHVSGGPNFGYELVSRSVSEEQKQALDLSAWKVAFSGSEPINPATIRRFAKTFAVAKFNPGGSYPCYGMAETTLFITGSRLGEDPVIESFAVSALENNIAHPPAAEESSTELVGCGQAILDQEVKIVDPVTLTHCSVGRVGEIWVRGRNVARGYWGDEQKTRETFQAYISDTGDGPFLRTGDLGFLKGKELFVTGRIKELIIINGVNHYPQDLERAAEKACPDLGPDAGAAFSFIEGGEEKVVLVYEIARTSMKKEREEMLTKIQAAINQEHGLVLHCIALIRPGHMKKTTSGKIQRLACRQAFIRGELEIIARLERAVTKKEDPVTVTLNEHSESAGPLKQKRPYRKSKAQRELEKTITESLGHILEIKAANIDLQTPLARYGMNSIVALRLAGEISESTGQNLQAVDFYEYPDIESLAAFLSEKSLEPAFESNENNSGQPGAARRSGRRDKIVQDIAIIGIGCRFPGAESPEEFWNLLVNEVDAVSEVPRERWDAGAFYDPLGQTPGKMNTRWGGFLKNIELFDSEFFGITPREAERMDPQQRILLEIIWEALEDAGLQASGLRGGNTGVFIGISGNEYSRNQFARLEDIDAYAGTGNALSIAANRVSYQYDWHGPSMAVDTACSSSLVALELARQCLIRGESDLAVAGGVNLILGPELGVNFTSAGVTSPDGRCRVFDASAGGIVRSEGAGVVLLKPADQAIQDGDKIYALVRGGAITQDGRTNGIMAPNPAAQKAVLQKAYQSAEVSPGDIDYIEAHGTGTLLGDPIEVTSLAQVLSPGRPRESEFSIGSVKSNLGHMEAAAGIAGIIKTALALHKRLIPGNLHYNKPNPHIPFEDYPMHVQARKGPWPYKKRSSLAGVSSFGFGGTNAHIVLEEYRLLSLEADGSDGARIKDVVESPLPGKVNILPLSAKNQFSLRELAGAFSHWLGARGSDMDIDSMCAYQAHARDHFNVRQAITFSNKAELQNKLKDIHELGQLQTPSIRNGVVFIFPGQGTHWWAMGRKLLETEPVFREEILRCDKLFSRHLDWSVYEELMASEENSRFHETLVIQCSLFAIQRSLAILWFHYGVLPEAVVGHSMGEITAANISGAIDLEEAVRIIYERGRIMHQATYQGAMAAVELSVPDTRQALSGYEDRLSIAAHNSSTSTVIAGEESAMKEVLGDLEQREVFFRRLKVNGIAGHSPQVDFLRQDFKKSLNGVRTTNGSIPMYSTVTGNLIRGAELNSDYWVRNIREPVLFANAVASLIDEGYQSFIEISPHPTLVNSISAEMMRENYEGIVLPSLKKNEDDRKIFFGSLSRLYSAGYDIAWKNLYPGRQNLNLTHLKTPPGRFWRKSPYWLAPPDNSPRPTSVAGLRYPDTGYAFLHPRFSFGLAGDTIVYEFELNLAHYPELMEHKIRGKTVLPAAVYLEMCLEALYLLEEAAADNIESDNRYEEIELQNTVFKEALLLSAGESKIIQLVLTPAFPRGGDIAISSYLKEEGESFEAGHIPGRNQTRHFSASYRINPAEDAGMKTRPPEKSNVLEELKRKLRLEIPPGDFYEYFDELGMEYGEFYKVIEELKLNETPSTSSNSDEALARIKTKKLATTGYIIDPIVLDACFQSLGGVGLDYFNNAPFLPGSIGSLRFYPRVKREENFWCHARGEIGEKSGAGEITAYNDIHAPFLKIEDLRVQKLLIAKPDPGILKSLFTLDWLEQEKSSSENYRGNTRPGTWLVLGGWPEIQAKIRGVLETRGRESEVIEIERESALDTDLLEKTLRQGSDIQGIIFTPENSSQPSREIEQTLRNTENTLLLIQILEKLGIQLQIVFLSGGVHAPEEPTDEIVPGGAGISGVVRVACLEYPHQNYLLCDLSQNPDANEIEFFVDDILDIAGTLEENILAYRKRRRYVARLSSWSLSAQGVDKSYKEAPGDRETNKPAYRQTPAIIANLAGLPREPLHPAPGQVKIVLRNVGLTYQNLTNSPDSSYLRWEQNLSSGEDCYGTIIEVGEGVEELTPGTAVIFQIPGSSIANEIITDAELISLAPRNINFETGAGLVGAYFTARYALEQKGRIKTGESILIHSAASGAGLAALHIATQKGLEVFATAESETRREYLRTLGVKAVMDSHNGSFYDTTLRLTGGRGVDLVFNTLSGVLMEKSLMLVASGGRFLEIGQKDIFDNSRMALSHFKSNQSFIAINSAALIADQPEEAKVLRNDILRHLSTGKLPVLPIQTFPLERAREAFALMAGKDYVGQVTVEFPDLSGRSGQEQDPAEADNKNATWLITNGLSDSGLLYAGFLCRCRIHTLIVTDPETPDALTRSRLNELSKKNKVKIFYRILDPADRAALKLLLNEIRETFAPLKGVIHSTKIIKGGPLTELIPGEIRETLGPELSGAWNVHLETARDNLTHLIFNSSFSSMLGIPSKGMDAVGAAFVDSLSRLRQGQGLPAQSIHWGAIRRVGRPIKSDVSETEKYEGATRISPGPGIDMLEELLSVSLNSSGAVRIRFDEFRKFVARYPDHSLFKGSYFRNISQNEREITTTLHQDLKEKIRGLAGPERKRAIESNLKEIASVILQTLPERLDFQTPLNSLGIDSLMAVEFRNRIQATLGVKIFEGHILKGASLEIISCQIDEKLSQQPGPDISYVFPTRARSFAEATSLKPELSLPQHWFFSHQLESPEHWNITLLLKTKSLLDVSILRKAFTYLLRHHKIFQLGIRNQEGVPSPFMRRPDKSAGEFEHHQLTENDLAAGAGDISGSYDKLIEGLCARAQTGLNFDRGPALKLLYIETKDTSPDHLLITIHHLLADGYSLLLFMRDLENVYEQVKTRQSPGLPGDPYSYFNWCVQLKKLASSSELKDELSYWTSAEFISPEISEERFPADLEDGIAYEGSFQKIPFTLDESISEEIGLRAQKTNVDVTHILLAAFALAWTEYYDQPSLYLEYESHGRDPGFEGLDLGRAIGWCNTMYPLRISPDKDWTLDYPANIVKTCLEAVPRKGLGYGILKYLSDDAEIKSKMGTVIEPRVKYLYHGKLIEQLTETLNLFTISELDPGANYGPRNIALHDLYVYGYYVNNRLRLELNFSRNVFRLETMKGLMEKYVDTLINRLIRKRNPRSE